jgi:hypothetical protein
MSQQELRYLGNGPGQGEGVAIGGIQYKPNETHKFDADRAADLLRRGGWEVVKLTKPKKERLVAEEGES